MRLRTAAAQAADRNGRSLFSVWLQALRVHFVPPSFLPAILCGLIPAVHGRSFDATAFFLVVIGVTVNHFGLNLLDDAVDYLHFVDDTGPDEKNPYAGGSGVITNNLLSVRQVLIASAICFTITVAIGLYLTALKGWPVLAFGIFGLLCSIFYTVPPIKFGYRGFGELGLLVNFGPVIGLGAYYVQARTLALEPLLVSLILGWMMWSMIIINEIPDYEGDRRAGKMTLVARFGREAGVRLYILGLFLAYATLFFAVGLKLVPPFTLLGLSSLPLGWRSVRILRRHYRDPLQMAPANLAMIKVHFLTGVGLIAGYVLALIFETSLPV